MKGKVEMLLNCFKNTAFDLKLNSSKPNEPYKIFMLIYRLKASRRLGNEVVN